MGKESAQDSRRKKFLEELEEQLSDPIHRRLIKACQADNPVQSMESELGKILLEILHRED